MDTSLKLDLKEGSRIREFVDRIATLPFKADLSSGKRSVDGKSVLGLFTLDLSKAVNLTIHAEPAECRDFVGWLGKRGMIR